MSKEVIVQTPNHTADVKVATEHDVIVKPRNYILSSASCSAILDGTVIPDWLSKSIIGLVDSGLDGTTRALNALDDFVRQLDTGVSQQITAVQTESESKYQLLTQEVARLDNDVAAISTLAQSKVTPEEATALFSTLLTSQFNDVNSDANAWIVEQNQTLSNAVTANANSLSLLSADYNGLAVSLQSLDTVVSDINGWAAESAKFITAPDGSITGWEFADGSGQPSSFNIRADVFQLLNADGSATPLVIDATDPNDVQMTFSGVVNFTNTDMSEYDNSLLPPPTYFSDACEDISNITGSASTSETLSTDSFSGNGAYLLTSSVTSPIASGTTGASRIVIPENIALSLAGKPVLISVYAKQPATNASAEFALAYSTNDNGNSGWINFTPTTSYKKYSFNYVIPEPISGGTDYFGINADTSASGLGILIDSITIEPAEDLTDILSSLATLEETNDGVVSSFYQTTAPTTSMSYGDWWVDTDSVPTKAYRYEDINGKNVGTLSWVDNSESIIGKSYLAALNAQSTANSKITTFYQTTTPTALTIGDIWIDTDDNYKQYRWSGSSWVAVNYNPATAINTGTTTINGGKLTTDTAWIGGKVVSATYDWNTGTPIGFGLFSTGELDSGNSYNIVGGKIYGGQIDAPIINGGQINGAVISGQQFKYGENLVLLTSADLPTSSKFNIYPSAGSSFGPLSYSNTPAGTWVESSIFMNLWSYESVVATEDKRLLSYDGAVYDETVRRYLITNEWHYDARKDYQVEIKVGGVQVFLSSVFSDTEYTTRDVYMGTLWGLDIYLEFNTNWTSNNWMLVRLCIIGSTIFRNFVHSGQGNTEVILHTQVWMSSAPTSTIAQGYGYAGDGIDYYGDAILPIIKVYNI